MMKECENCEGLSQLALHYGREGTERMLRNFELEAENAGLRAEVRKLKGWLIAVCIGVAGSAVYRGVVGALS